MPHKSEKGAKGGDGQGDAKGKAGKGKGSDSNTPCFYCVVGLCRFQREHHRCGRPGINHRDLTDAQKEAFTRWKEAGYAKSAAAESAAKSPPAVPGLEGKGSTKRPKASPALPATKPKAKNKSICSKFLKGRMQ